MMSFLFTVSLHGLPEEWQHACQNFEVVKKGAIHCNVDKNREIRFLPSSFVTPPGVGFFYTS
jgi:hypothetical protein